ncbi:MAG TPA: M48 family metallopeptidase [Stellaceae bacterium]|nr:M48 family metallopeptidase [Stellaceae bacterium]
MAKSSLLRMELSSLSLMGGTVPVRVSTHPRARRMALRIDPQGEAVDLVLPPRSSLPRALEFFEDNRRWLERRLAALPPRTVFADGALVPVLGVPHRIRHVPASGGRGAVWIEDTEIHVAGDRVHLPRRVRDHLRERARRELLERARRLAETIDRKVVRVSVRDTRTRWGSCSATGNLCFSWRLIFAPDEVLAYVVAHEVAHLVHMNHGKRFWRLVERLAPGAGRQRQWLNRNRAQLLRIG